MGFYEDFIDKYDILVSWENRYNRETDFFKTVFQQFRIKSVLDCACGTGQHVIIFNEMGLDSYGSDLSPAMVKRAKLNARKYKAPPRFRTSSFTDLSKNYNKRFDALVCVGNSLPHVLQKSDLKKSISEFHKMLNPGGCLIIEQRNFDHMMKKRPRFLPMSMRESEGFIYAFDYKKDKIIFNVLNMDLANKSLKVYSTTYKALKKTELVSLLKEKGFKNLKLYGDMKFTKFNMNSNSLIIICRK